MSIMYVFFKRFFDVVSAFLLLVLISPIFLIIVLLIRVNLGKPIFFHQTRSGMGMKSFEMTKFRTMSEETDSDGNLLPDKERSTKFGQWLRSTSLDELPELINIIKGDMSVIGPRPLYPRYNEYYTEEEKKRFLVRGGLITPDSVDPEPIISWEKQLQYEAEYAENLSLLLDLEILVSVFRILFKRNTTNYGSYSREPLDIERSKN